MVRPSTAILMIFAQSRITRSIDVLTLLLCAFASAYSSGAELFLSPCTLKSDPEDRLLPMTACLNASAGTAVEQRTQNDSPEQPPYLAYANGKLTLLPHRWILLQASGHVEVRQRRTVKTDSSRDASPDTTLLQIGNTALHRHRVFAGKGVMPFGLNLNANSKLHPHSYYLPYYGRRVRLAGYTYDNRRDLTATFTVGYIDGESRAIENRLIQGSVRFAYDFAALEGTRIITSFFHDELIHRRGSFAMLNRNGRGDVTTFEVVRTWTFFPYDPEDFRQLIRLNWSGDSSDDSRVSVQYEDTTQVYRTGLVTYIHKALEHAFAEATVGYRKSEDSALKSHWFSMFGIEARL